MIASVSESVRFPRKVILSISYLLGTVNLFVQICKKIDYRLLFTLHIAFQAILFTYGVIHNIRCGGIHNRIGLKIRSVSGCGQ